MKQKRHARMLESINNQLQFEDPITDAELREIYDKWDKVTPLDLPEKYKLFAIKRWIEETSKIWDEFRTVTASIRKR
jgi:hypothetical protein